MFLAEEPELFDLKSWLERNQHVKFVRLYWVDLSGVVRLRCLTKKFACKVASREVSYGVGPGATRVPLTEVQLRTPNHQGLVQLRPDWASIKICGFAPSHAFVMCSVFYEGHDDPRALCSRSLLRKAINQGHQRGFHFKVGFEIEFVLLNEHDELPLTSDNGYRWSTSGGLRGQNLKVLEDIIAALEESGIAVTHFHTEIPPCYEICLEPLPPLEAIEATYLSIETIRHVSVQHGLYATMSPKPFVDPESVNISRQMHISIEGGSTATNHNFLSGILRLMQPICAVAMACYDSYRRIKEMTDSVGVWVSYGTENRDVPLRRIADNHWELRLVDASADLHLICALVILSGLKGIEADIKTELRDCRLCPGNMTPEEFAAMGISKALPRTQAEAINFFQNCSISRDVLGVKLHETFVQLKELDIEGFSRLSEGERTKKLLKIF